MTSPTNPRAPGLDRYTAEVCAKVADEYAEQFNDQMAQDIANRIRSLLSDNRGEVATPVEGEVEAALTAYNKVWNSTTEIDASTVDNVRRSAMTAALAALHRLQNPPAGEKGK